MYCIVSTKKRAEGKKLNGNGNKVPLASNINMNLYHVFPKNVSLIYLCTLV